jgi:chemotaxis receptor (MCP) glutamine deamidase CheD
MAKKKKNHLWQTRKKLVAVVVAAVVTVSVVTVIITVTLGSVTIISAVVYDCEDDAEGMVVILRW